jgi:hypothetical protein
MSPQSNPHVNPKTTTAERAQVAVGVRLPTVRQGNPRRFPFQPGKRVGRMRERYLLARRPILNFLVTHRRRFTTGHKHKQAFKG